MRSTWICTYSKGPDSTYSNEGLFYKYDVNRKIWRIDKNRKDGKDETFINHE